VLVECVTAEYQDCVSNGGVIPSTLCGFHYRQIEACSKYDASDIRIGTFCLNRMTKTTCITTHKPILHGMVVNA
jgi:hypothetical protein